jgi:endonuclease G
MQTSPIFGSSFFGRWLARPVLLAVLLLAPNACRYVVLNPVNPRDLPGRDAHLALGNPSNATPSVANYDNYLMEKPQFALSYNRSRGMANWVAWHLSQGWRGQAPRQNNFRTDPALPPGWARTTSDNYTNSGFDRGHICPSDDRDGSPEDNSATFLMTNIMPQAPENNQQTWRFLEEYCRRLAAQGNELYIYAGGYGRGGAGSQGRASTVGGGQVVVPSRTWKVILVLPVGEGDLERIGPETRLIAVDMPNTQTVANRDWGFYRVSVDELEEATGLDFFGRLPSVLQRTIEARTDRGPTE